LENQPLPVMPPWAIFGLYLTAALLGMTVTRLDWPAWAELGLALALLGGFSALTFWWYRQGGALLPLGGPALALMGATGWSYAEASRRERRQKRFIKGAFARYLHPDWVERLVADPDLLQLRGERRELTVLFTDVAGFTTTSEELPPDTLVWVLSRYLQGMTDIIITHGGAVNKYLGDGIMVLFGAPVAQADHALRAVRCALALDQFAEAFRNQASGPDGRPVAFGQTRIGVHTGEATVGNFGSQARLEYTAIGDVVNAASRLEGLNSSIGTRIAVSDATREQALRHDASDLRFRPMGRIVVKGKQKALHVFNPLAADPESIALVDDYATGYTLLEAGDPRAAGRFAELQTRYPDDPLVEFYVRRVQAHEYTSRITLTTK
jgi:class 3 adenylate cyclase